MTPKPQLRLMLALLVCLAGNGCSSVSMSVTGGASASAARERAIEQHRGRANAFASRGEYAEALIEWNIIEALAPRDREVETHRSALKRTIAVRAAEHLAAGRRALRRRNTSAAERELLMALALEPRNSDAIAHLREIDKIRTKGVQMARVERLARSRGDALAHVTANPNDGKTNGPSAHTHSSKFETVSISEEPGAKSTSPSRASADSNSGEDKKALAEQLYGQAIRVYRSDVNQSIALLQQAVSHSPEHVKAQRQLRKAIKVRATLQRIEQLSVN